MKTKSTIIIALVAAAAAGLLHAEPPRPLPAEDQAKLKVQSEILAKISPQAVLFSRAAPMPRENLRFEPQILVENESRLPFAVVPVFPAKPKTPPILQGYVRMSDQAIFLIDTSTGQHVPAAQHPRLMQQQNEKKPIEKLLGPLVPVRTNPA